MVFGNGLKNIQAAAYNGARTVFHFEYVNEVLGDKLIPLHEN